MAKTLNLSVSQRMNTKSILEAREPRSNGDARLQFKIIDKLELTDEEKERAAYRTAEAGPPGATQTVVMWGTGADEDFKADIVLEDAEHDKLKEVFSGYIPGLRTGNPSVRVWYEPLLTSLGL